MRITQRKRASHIPSDSFGVNCNLETLFKMQSRDIQRGMSFNWRSLKREVTTYFSLELKNPLTLVVICIQMDANFLKSNFSLNYRTLMFKMPKIRHREWSVRYCIQRDAACSSDENWLKSPIILLYQNTKIVLNKRPKIFSLIIYLDSGI